MEKTIEIPEGYEARIEGNKVILELKESEDEHRKWILEYLYDGLRKSDEQFKDQFKSAIAWFEKQGSQNLANSEKTCKVEQNPAWSEEDERVKQDIENLIHFALRDGSAVSPGADTTKEGALGWLKSLKERYTWKPSKEQIKAIEDSIQFLGCTKKVREDLKSLYNDLKKLKG